jgi:hypothetical protein
MSHPCRIKSRDEIDFLQTSCFQPRAIPKRRADLRPPPKNYLYEIVLVLKISTRSVLLIEKCSTFFEVDRHLPSHPYADGQKYYALFDTFHFTTFALLIPFVKDN